MLLSTENKATVESVAKLQTQWVQDPNVPAKDVLTDPKTLRHYVVLTDGEYDARHIHTRHTHAHAHICTRMPGCRERTSDTECSAKGVVMHADRV